MPIEITAVRSKRGVVGKSVGGAVLGGLIAAVVPGVSIILAHAAFLIVHKTLTVFSQHCSFWSQVSWKQGAAAGGVLGAGVGLLSRKKHNNASPSSSFDNSDSIRTDTGSKGGIRGMLSNLG